MDELATENDVDDLITHLAVDTFMENKKEKNMSISSPIVRSSSDEMEDYASQS